MWQIIITKATVYLGRQWPARKGRSSYIVLSVRCFFKTPQMHLTPPLLVSTTTHDFSVMQGKTLLY